MRGTPQVPFTFGVEIFEPGHRTTPHSHASAHELFFILAGAPGAVRHAPLKPSCAYSEDKASCGRNQDTKLCQRAAALSLNNESWLQ